MSAPRKPDTPEGTAGRPSPRQNRLLSALPEDIYQRLAGSLELAELPLGKSLYESGAQLRHLYFIASGIVSLLYVTESGLSAEIALAGSEGVVGISLFMGGESTPSRAVVQAEGYAYRVKASALMQEFDTGGALQHVLLRYTQALITQMTQTAVCNRHHSVDQQLCRWLLMSLDRLRTNELHMTHELIANMLGVRREGVSESAGKLQKQGLIEYHRGHIKVLNRVGVEACACECYTVVKRESDRLLAYPLKAAPRAL
jgi:CRP-like cAMP-binding protein